MSSPLRKKSKRDEGVMRQPTDAPIDPTDHAPPPPVTYTCSSCKETIAEDSLASHIKEEHASLVLPMMFYICRECGFKSSEKDRVRQHAANNHDVTDVMPFPVKSRPSLVLEKLFPEKRVVTNEECDRHDSHLVDDEEEDTEGETAGQQFVCKMCQRTLNSEEGAVIHVKKHYPTRQYHCTICLYQAVDGTKVRAHLRTEHKSRDQPINIVVDDAMKLGLLDTVESCFPKLTNGVRAALFGKISEDYDEHCEDTKRLKLERAAEAAAAPSVSATDSTAPAAPAAVPNDRAISPSTTEAEEEEEVDVFG